uniref:Uncharacterized protein n=1 Tax=Parascaris univalens TaxID=6257 RepID=A0A915BEP7_PARUN
MRLITSVGLLEETQYWMSQKQCDPSEIHRVRVFDVAANLQMIIQMLRIFNSST